MAGQEFDIWTNTPSLPAAAVFMVLFAITSFFHTWQAYKLRSRFMISFIIGGFLEVGGYIGRIAAHSNDNSVEIFIWHTVFLLISPTLLAVSVYMTLGRIILHTRGDHLAPIVRSTMVKIFVAGEVFSLMVQFAGGVMLAPATTSTSGKAVVLVALGIQIVTIGAFIGISALFHRRLTVSPTMQAATAPWRRYMYSLYAASAFLLIRSVFRIVAFQGVHDGELMFKEFYLSFFDALLMLGVMVSFNVAHPGQLDDRYETVDDAVPLAKVQVS